MVRVVQKGRQKRTKGMAEKSRELHIIFKNKHADFPVQNAIQVKALLGLT